MDKKGSILDLFGILLAIIVIVTCGFIGLTATKGFNEQVLKVDNSTEVQTATSAVEGGYGLFINLLPFVIFSFLLVSVIYAYFIASHPIYFPFAIILFMFLVMVTTFISNFLWQFINAPEIASVANDFPITTMIIQNLPLLIIVCGFFILIALYAKAPSGQEFSFG